MTKLFDVAGKVALVTGASSGIGRMIAAGFSEAGMRVYICSRKASDIEATANELGCTGFVADLSKPTGIPGIVAELMKREPYLDVLVNNAGATWGAPLDTYPEAGWDKVMDLNVKSAFFLTQALLPMLKAAPKAARVINIASVNGRVPPNLETYAYSSSKAALIMLTRHLGKRLAPDILVNAIAPGPFPSKMMAGTLDAFGDHIANSVPLRRLGEKDDIVGAAVFLASRAGAYMTGAVIPCDGGMGDL